MVNAVNHQVVVEAVQEEVEEEVEEEEALVLENKVVNFQEDWAAVQEEQEVVLVNKAVNHHYRVD